ncbi:MAG TPA: PIG-L family deacetylase [Pyrinomonadaceae bacterium]|nr:PIG-L family deacetylase [Pyrinomonadaceae bacterium]
MSEHRSLLFIFAHPDDESFGAAGTAARYAEEGARLTLVTATRGDKGKCGEPPVCRPEELAAVREAELREAARLLGIGDVRVFDYLDRELASAPADEVRAQLVRVIREVRPQVVVTFDPHGVNLHPDHVAISRFASDAVSAAADPRWHPEAGPAHRVGRLLWTTPRPFFDLARLERPEREPGVDFLVNTSRWWGRKAAALRAHRSQHLQIDKLFFDVPDSEAVLSVEAFRDAWRGVGSGMPPDDIFAGL